jgi:uncharacterized protein
MMISEDDNAALYRIRSIDENSITINDIQYDESLIVSPNKLIHPWPCHSHNDLNAHTLQHIIALKPEFVIIGVGKKFTLINPALLKPLYDADLGVECMDTTAAARTYSALSAEGRLVAAALIINEH